MSKRRRMKAGSKPAALAVHIFTALGAALGFVALVFASGGAFSAMFLTLGVALLVDGVDGPMARYFQIQRTLPRWSGETLDLVVDFTTYVFVPAFAIAAANIFVGWWAIAAGALIVVTGALYFADGNMKSNDNYFLGFPAVWNLVAFYLLLVRPQPFVAALVILLFAALTFVPVPFVHPLRVKRWRPVTIVLLALWALLALFATLENLFPPAWVTIALCAIAVYFLLAGLVARRS